MLIVYILRTPNERTGNPDMASGEPAHVPDPLLPSADPAVPMEPEHIVVSDDEVPPAVIAARRKQNRRKRRMSAASDAIRNIRRKQNVIEISSDEEEPVFIVPSNIRIGPPPRCNKLGRNAQA